MSGATSLTMYFANFPFWKFSICKLQAFRIGRALNTGNFVNDEVKTCMVL